MLKNLILVAILICGSAKAFDAEQFAGIVLIGALINQALADNTNSTVLTDEFILASIWVGNVYGIIDILGWVLDWVAGYIFFAKSDTKEVLVLKDKLRDLEKQQRSIYYEKLKLASSVCDKLIVNSNKMNKEDLTACIRYIEDIFRRDLTEDEVAIAL